MALPTTRERIIPELALEWIYRMPYERLRGHVLSNGYCTEAELLQYGRMIYEDACRLYRGEISWIKPIKSQFGQIGIAVREYDRSMGRLPGGGK